ncbi:uncharacterized protein LOC124440894 [Xenia sp. Carnegie-2017]|uniref:uncharacterized protein LOC124440894 n=1 Tax=Xenia sp. Carnegie-2017 TaxID=2897299 RepID=UPI001F04DF7D|nr:uncharacterized protein LOC124440894 [Xenia sp. Carnegie-2017]
MDLHGGMTVTLEPSRKANITYLFTNLYPLDRIGYCVFHLWDKKSKFAHTIRFNTVYGEKDDKTLLGSFYNSFVGGENNTKKCETVDLDPRKKCKPVNCVQKYNGKRNFFRRETKLCEPVHECFTSKDEDGLPTTAFDKDHNKCKSLTQKKLSREEEENMKRHMKRRMDDAEKENTHIMNTIRCNHGQRAGDICVCDDGWKTDTSNVPLGDPKFVNDWCNVRTRKKPFLSYHLQKRFMIVVSFSL